MESVRWFDPSLEGKEHRVARHYALAMGGLGSLAYEVCDWLTVTPLSAFLVAVILMAAGGYVGTEYRLMYRRIRKTMSLTKLLHLLLPSAPFVLVGTILLGVACGFGEWEAITGFPKTIIKAYLAFN